MDCQHHLANTSRSFAGNTVLSKRDEASTGNFPFIVSNHQNMDTKAQTGTSKEHTVVYRELCDRHLGWEAARVAFLAGPAPRSLVRLGLLEGSLAC